MQTQPRIPALHEVTFDGALRWFADLQQGGLLFHPEDDPAEVIGNESGKPLFTPAEVQELLFVMDALESTLGHEQFVEAAYPVFMHAAGIRLDA